jgi:hypothetical protein
MDAIPNPKLAPVPTRDPIPGGKGGDGFRSTLFRPYPTVS